MTAHSARRRRIRAVATVASTVVAGLALSSCSLPFLGGSSSVSDSDAVDFDGVQSATLQIEARGTFVSPEEGGYEAAGRGSGFLISPDGIAVTNNHVVVGAGTLDVWIGGDQGRTYNAKVLGSSECLDLAVIQLQDGEYPHFAWHEGEITVAEDVYAAGFPLGDPTFTMTRGIVSKASTPGETPWASLDSVIEHDARIRGGNSGGPLVDPDGRVVGVNYAGSDLYDTNLAIHRDEVLAALEQMTQGEDVLSLGINGEALTDSEGNGLGVWVNSVAAGSIADEAGVEPGDLLTRLQGVTLATDGTMSEYCDVLRTQGTDATIEVELYRPTDELYWRGQFNGDPLEPVEVIGGGGGSASGEFEVVTDDTGVIEVEVPAAWSDIDGEGYTDDYGSWASISASPDLDGFTSSWDVPGVFIAASEEAYGVAEPIDLLSPLFESMPSQGCVSDGAQDYDDGYHTGVFAIFEDCGGIGARYVVVVADGPGYLVQVGVQANNEGDLAAVDRVLGSFYASF